MKSKILAQRKNKGPYQRLADKADRAERRLSQGDARARVDKAQENLDQIRPLALGKLYGCNSCDALRSNRAGLDVLRVKSPQYKLLDLAADLDIEGEPTGRVLCLTRAVL